MSVMAFNIFCHDICRLYNEFINLRLVKCLLKRDLQKNTFSIFINLKIESTPS